MEDGREATGSTTPKQGAAMIRWRSKNEESPAMKRNWMETVSLTAA